MAPKLFWIRGPWRGRLGITARPRGGDWLEDEVRSWREAGVDAVVSLLEPGEEADLDLTDEFRASRAGGLAYWSLPIPDLGLPRSREAVAKLVDEIVDALRSGKSVAVHCRQGIGRSALMVAATLIAGGLNPDTAVDAIRESRGLDVPETEAQRQWIRDFSEWLSNRRTARQQHAFDVASRRT